MRHHLQRILMLLLVIVLMCALAIPAYAAKIRFTPAPTRIPAWTAPPTPTPTLIPAWTAPPTATTYDWMKQEQERGFSTTPTPTPAPTPTPVFTRMPFPTDKFTPLATPTPTDSPSEPNPLPAPSVAPTATPAPTQSAAASTPKPASTAASAMTITKHPTGEVVDSGGSATFIAKADNYSWCAWRFVSPDGSTEVIFDVSSAQFPGLKIEGGNNQILKLSNIPAEMNGWSAMCLFADANGKWIYSDGALITVKNTAAVSTPAATPAPTATPSPTQTPAPTATPVPDTTSPASPGTVPAGVVDIPLASPSPTPEPEKDSKEGRGLMTVLLVVIALLLVGGGTAFMQYNRKMKAAEERRIARRFRCNNCGWSPKSLNDIPNFCPRCGDEFNEEDIRR